MSAARKKAPPVDDDPPLTTVERAALAALGWRHAGASRRADGMMTLSFFAPGAAPDALPEQRTRAEWRAILAAGQAERAINAGDVDAAEQLVEQTRKLVGRAQAAQTPVNELGASPPIRRGAPLRLSATAVAAFAPGPDADGVFRRPPDMPERLMAPPRDLVDGRWQPREVYDQEALGELTESIREHGVLEDLIAIVNEQGEFELITGHRRKRAALAAGGRDVPVRVVEVTAAQADEIAIISNDARSDLTELERGRAYERIIAERGISEAELAKKLSRPRSYIQQRRALARATPEVQQAYAQGKLSFTAVRGICDGSGGDHEVQKATVASALRALKNGGNVTGEGLQRQAQQIIFERAEDVLKKLGWKPYRLWQGSTPHVYWFTATAPPVEWSPAEILAAVKELRRPPAEKPEIAQLTKEDMEQLGRRNWKVDPNFAPWPAVQRDENDLVFGEQALAAAAQARADVAALIARFQAKEWTVAFKYTSYWIVSTGKGKSKREESCHGYGEALKLIEKIEKGKLPPAKASEGYTYAPVCEVCRRKNPNHKNLDGLTVCASCAPPIEARLAAERATIVEALAAAGVPAWLEQAPAFVADLLLAQNRGGWLEPVLGLPNGYIEPDRLDQHIQTLTPEQRQAALCAVVTALAWQHRPAVTARHLAPATAVAAPPTAPESGAETPAPAGRALAEILAELSVIEERWAGSGMGSADGDTLEALAEDLEAQIGELDAEVYDAAAAQIAGLLRRLLEQGVPS